MFVEGHDAVTFGVVHMVGEDGGAGLLCGRISQQFVEFVAVEDVVTEDKGDAVLTDELFTNDESLRQAIGAGLHGVFKLDTPLAAIAEQLLEARGVLWRRDDKDFPNTRQHERG